MNSFTEQEYFTAGQMNDLFDFITSQNSEYSPEEINEKLGRLSDEEIGKLHAFVFDNANRSLKDKIIATVGETIGFSQKIIEIKETLDNDQERIENEEKEELANQLVNMIYEHDGLMNLFLGATGNFPNRDWMLDNFMGKDTVFLTKIKEMVERITK